MKKEIRIAPRNSIVFIMDKTIGKLPESMNNRLFASTESCFVIGTRCEIDGMTSILISDEVKESDCGETIVFDGVLNTPSKKLSICNVLNETILDYDVPWLFTKIHVCANHASEPDEIQIYISSGNR